MKLNLYKKLKFFFQIKNKSILIFFGLISSFIFFLILISSKFLTNLHYLDPLLDNAFFQINKSPLYGIISNIVIFLWLASFSIILYLITKFKEDNILKSSKKLRNSLYAGASFCLILFFFDLYDLQNKFREEFIYAYLMFNSIYLFWYIFKTSFYKNKVIILFSSFMFLAFSMTMDLYQSRNIFNIAKIYTTTFEELFKFLGASYFTFFWVENLREIYKQNKIFK